MTFIQKINGFLKNKIIFLSLINTKAFRIQKFNPVILITFLIIFSILFFVTSNLINKKNEENVNNFKEIGRTNEFSNFKNFLFSKINSPYEEINYVIKNNDTVEKILKKFGNKILRNLEENGCKIIGDNKIRKIYDKKIQKASIKDWSKEYLSPVVSVKSVKNIDEAIAHINKYGTMHTDCIITQNKKAAKKFLNEVKSSIAMHNTSTQFADGGEFGFGGEVGISTNTLPPRGPVGLNQLISYKYQVTSKGQVRK